MYTSYHLHNFELKPPFRFVEGTNIRLLNPQDVCKNCGHSRDYVNNEGMSTCPGMVFEGYQDYQKTTVEEDSCTVIEALKESNELILADNVRQRRLIGRLRKTVSDLRRLKNIQIQNDQAFMALCQEDISDVT